MTGTTFRAYVQCEGYDALLAAVQTLWDTTLVQRHLTEEFTVPASHFCRSADAPTGEHQR